ncbi:PREDICTED: uncharacterized protein LOC108550846 [Eufriesea mexicana]|uniref:uncharacterized protein LOC108550846 n=1 Tax=Eufriesea mexicana TaxID=516756 RepID=UPI00083C7D98|nr:PREDICTED: uncharacterized protein LOC108550846 [Eufriesea mexicana]
MNSLFQSCILRKLSRKLFRQKIPLVRPIFTYSINNNSKKFTPFLQARQFFIENNKGVKEVLIYKANTKTIYVIKILHIVLLIIVPILLCYTYVNRNILSNQNIREYLETALFAIVCIISARYILKRYVSEIHYNPEEQKFSARIMNPILKSYQITFNENEITVPKDKLNLVMCVTKEKSLLLLNQYFTNSKFIAVMTKSEKLKNFEVPKLQTDALNQIPSTKMNNQVERKKIDKM